MAELWRAWIDFWRSLQGGGQVVHTNGSVVSILD